MTTTNSNQSSEMPKCGPCGSDLSHDNGGWFCGTCGARPEVSDQQAGKEPPPEMEIVEYFRLRSERDWHAIAIRFVGLQAEWDRRAAAAIANLLAQRSDLLEACKLAVCALGGAESGMEMKPGSLTGLPSMAPVHSAIAKAEGSR